MFLLFKRRIVNLKGSYSCKTTEIEINKPTASRISPRTISHKQTYKDIYVQACLLRCVEALTIQMSDSNPRPYCKYCHQHQQTQTSWRGGVVFLTTSVPGTGCSALPHSQEQRETAAELISEGQEKEVLGL